MTRPSHYHGSDYAIARSDADWLRGTVLMDAEIRVKVLQRYLRDNGADALVALFAQFMGLANSVVANNREMVELILITEAGMTPATAEQSNLPTVFGALQGVTIAAGIDQSKLCHGCAFRLGTVANQSPVTTSDADWCSHPGEKNFLCHMDGQAEGQHRKACAGFAQLRARRSKESAT